MAREDRPSSDHLTFLARAAGEVHRWEPFALLRGVEARARNKPRIGTSRLPAEDIIEIVQDPAPGFAPASFTGISPSPRGGMFRVAGRWFGLLGSMGPMPLHLSEYAHWEARYADGHPFARFLDLLARRMQQLFFRAWADGVPAVQADRPDDDRFAGYIAQLSGAAEGALADAPGAAAAPFPPHVRLAYASLFASRRSAVGIEDALSHVLGSKVHLLEYQPRHREIEPGDRTRLGHSFTTLGDGVLLGHRVRTVTDAFRIVIHARSAHDYRQLLPGGVRHRVAAAALDAFTPGHLEWDIALDVERADAMPARLDGRTQLGWTSWIRPERGPEHRRDAHLRRASGSGSITT